VVAQDSFAPGEVVVEYVGELVAPLVADLREKRYERKGMHSRCGWPAGVAVVGGSHAWC
jgi:hypothetical protein